MVTNMVTKHRCLEMSAMTCLRSAGFRYARIRLQIIELETVNLPGPAQNYTYIKLHCNGIKYNYFVTDFFVLYC
jgi:hypothetical protein